ncbi:MAG: ElyC/SanA/YdcF family protein [Candidatus Pacebacteria bacterium]|nr:ElyC/SanA/YdcF family protein [Candidatus Paceibacterota bacterium]MDD5752648.1 ElyC/SanA/YdcF family protein [Candidatus Paceibacterota bacterium]
MDLIVLLGGRFTFNVFEGLPPSIMYTPTKETELQLKALIRLAKKYPETKFLVMGGHNFFIKYDAEKVIETNFNFENMVKAQEYASEAEIISEIIERKGVNSLRILKEETSVTLEEKKEILKVLFERSAFREMKVIGIIVTDKFFHEDFNYFLKVFPDIIPFIAEDIVV